jgi:hypothetical protein
MFAWLESGHPLGAATDPVSFAVPPSLSEPLLTPLRGLFAAGAAIAAQALA